MHDEVCTTNLTLTLSFELQLTFVLSLFRSQCCRMARFLFAYLGGKQTCEVTACLDVIVCARVIVTIDITTQHKFAHDHTHSELLIDTCRITTGVATHLLKPGKPSTAALLLAEGVLQRGERHVPLVLQELKMFRFCGTSCLSDHTISCPVLALVEVLRDSD